MPIFGNRPYGLDEHTVVGASGARYPCPDLAAVDGHISDVSVRLRRCSVEPLRKMLAADVDRLLDRRYWLQLMAD